MKTDDPAADMALAEIANRPFDTLAKGDRATLDEIVDAADLAFWAELADAPDRTRGGDADAAGASAATYQLAATALVRLIGTRFPGAGSVIVGHELRAQRELRSGDRLTWSIEVAARDAATREVELAIDCRDADARIVFEGRARVVAPATRITRPRRSVPRIRAAGDVETGRSRLLAAVKSLPPMRAAVVHPCDATSLGAAIEARALGLIEPVIVAPRARIEALAKEQAIDLSGIALDDVPHSHAAAERAVELAAAGKVEALVKGSLHTDELMAAVVARDGGLRTKRRVSHCFVLETPRYPQPFIVTDAAINLAPGLMEKADIVQNAIALAHVIGVAEPKVAILAAVETISAAMPATLDAAALCKMAERGQITGGLLDGPLAFDNAVSPAAARSKGIVSAVAGHADILVVPDLESGNMLAKQLIYMGDAASAGIVLGARVPVVLTSRADSAESRIASTALARLLAERYRSAPP